MRSEEDAYGMCRRLIGHLVCAEITEIEFSKGFINCLIDAPLMAAKRATRGMRSSHLEILLPYIKVLETNQGIREHRGFINDGMDLEERRVHYTNSAEHALDVCQIARNNHRRSLEKDNGGHAPLRL